MSDPVESEVPQSIKLEEGPADEPKPRRVKGLLYVISILTGLTLLLCGGTVLAGWLYFHSVEGSIDRVDAFGGVPESARPSKATPKAINFLLLGSDSRAARDEPENGDTARADTIIVVHVAVDRQTAQLISIPRDTWVPVPGHGNNKINSAYAFGGIPLMVQTVEDFTKVRIDHVVLIDFYGFKDVIDALDGVDILVDQDFKSVHPPHRQFKQGMQHMNGEVALDYSRQRYQFKDGDFSRIEHQQQVIKAVMERAANKGLLTDAPKLNSFIRATANALTIDKDLSAFDLALELRQLRSNDLTFLTNPSKGTGNAGGQSVVFADPAMDADLYAAVNGDRVGAWLRANPQYAR
jgi:LCP family protein required for cell wall assembly